MKKDGESFATAPLLFGSSKQVKLYSPTPSQKIDTNSWRYFSAINDIVQTVPFLRNVSHTFCIHFSEEFVWLAMANSWVEFCRLFQSKHIETFEFLKSTFSGSKVEFIFVCLGKNRQMGKTIYRQILIWSV